MATKYWGGGTGTWDASDTTHWFAGTGSTGGTVAVPGSGDAVIFDGASGGGTVTVNTTINVTSITGGAFTGTLDFAANDNNVTLQTLDFSGTATRTLNMGDGTWTITGVNGAHFTLATVTGLTFNANSSTLVFSAASPTGQRTFNTGAKTYNIVTFAAASTATGYAPITITGGATFATWNITGPMAVVISGTTLTVTNSFDWTQASSAAPLILNGSSGSTISSANNGTMSWAALCAVTFSGGGTFTANNSSKFGPTTGITVNYPTVPAVELHRIEGGISASQYDPASRAIFSAFTTAPTTARKNLIDACVVSLKSAGVWTKLDVLYVLAAADAQAAKINWKNPGTFNSTEVNAPTFTADQGFTGASTKYLDTGFNPTTAPTPKITRNDAAIFGWSLTNASIVGGIIGQAGTGSGEGMIYPLNASSTQVYIHQGSASSFANADGSGFFCSTRRASSSAETYRNTTSLGTSGLASTAPISQNYNILRRATNYWTGQAAAAGFGSQLSAADVTALYDALRAYLTGVGVP